ncbi:PadR family transcriptional regulator [Paraburkholderia terrae]|uniref:PadR family transcriptional regulator n=1 Tax=Paraburkholderia terrae TaxID=311230 RepID=A0A2I8EUV0_9BURK|nr:PadR family transcriptional regulator [Paraburkholderia terrae]AUT63260.1 PadR family transcriptional regulator [Paraburkholderia terrae]
MRVSDLKEAKASKAKPLKNVLLAGLYNQPRSGYEMTKWLQMAGQHCWSVEHSSVYPALRELEKDGLIKSERLPGTRGPERLIYSVTDAGREELTAWVANGSPRPAIKDEQILRVLCFDLLPRETALQQIRAVRADHQAQLEFFLERQAVLTEHQLGPLLVTRRGVLAEQAYIAWCDEVAEMIARRPA